MIIKMGKNIIDNLLVDLRNWIHKGVSKKDVFSKSYPFYFLFSICLNLSGFHQSLLLVPDFWCKKFFELQSCCSTVLCFFLLNNSSLGRKHRIYISSLKGTVKTHLTPEILQKLLEKLIATDRKSVAFDLHPTYFFRTSFLNSFPMDILHTNHSVYYDGHRNTSSNFHVITQRLSRLFIFSSIPFLASRQNKYIFLHLKEKLPYSKTARTQYYVLNNIRDI